MMNEIFSVLFYNIIVFSASMLAFLAQINFKKGTLLIHSSNDDFNYLNKFFLFLSFLCLTLPVAFRHNTGTDYLSYVYIYNNVSLFGPFEMFPQYEIGFLMLNYLCSLIFNNYQSVFAITALITNILIYKGISYERRNISLGIAVFTYGFTLYFYSYVIIRNLLGIAIVFYGYRYLLEEKYKKFYIIVTIACMFHYSLAIYYIIGLLSKQKFNKIRLPIVLCFSAIIIISPNVINFILYNFSNIIPRISYYLNNILNNSLSITVYMVAYSLPVIPFIINYRKFIKLEAGNTIYFFIYSTSILLLLISSFNPIITRFVYSLWPALIILISRYVKHFDKTRSSKIMVILAIVLYGTSLIVKFVTIQSYGLLPYSHMFEIH